MTTIELINQKIQKLPEDTQSEILTFVEFLYYKSNKGTDASDSQWSSFSLDSAMRGMETENVPEYSPDDIKEKFS